jgi:outer membrane biosynthesis protein TonB
MRNIIELIITIILVIVGGQWIMDNAPAFISRIENYPLPALVSDPAPNQQTIVERIIKILPPQPEATTVPEPTPTPQPDPSDTPAPTPPPEPPVVEPSPTPDPTTTVAP